MPLKVLLIDAATDFSEVGLGVAHNMVHPPLGLMLLASYVRSCFSADTLSVVVCDAAIQCGNFAAVADLLAEHNPDLVGLRSLSSTYRQLHELARLAKAHNPAILVVAGGPYAGDAPAQILEDLNVDLVCPAEGEYVLRELIAALLDSPGSRDFRAVAGLYYRSQEAGCPPCRKTALRPQIADLDAMPFPDYGDIDLDRYASFHALTSIQRRYALLLTSRGCPYRCIYCHSLFGKNFRHRSPGNILAEIRSLYDRFGLRDFLIIDDIFNFQLDHAKEVLAGICSLPFKVRLFFPNGLRGDRLDEEFLDLLVEAGTVEVVYAIESASPRIQRMIKKKLDLEKVEAAIEATRERGLIVNGFFMIGFPSETPGELSATVAMILRLIDSIHFPYIGIVRAYPGSAMYRLAGSLGYSEEFLRRHVRVPLGTQECIRAECNFLPTALLQEARTRVALAFKDFARTSAMLAVQRKYFTDEELVMKYATFFGSTPRVARLFLKPFGLGRTGQVGAAQGNIDPSLAR